MTEALFYITNGIAIAAALAVAWGFFMHGRKFGDETVLLRRFAAAAFTMWALQRASMFSVARAEGVEIFASLPLILISVVAIITTVYGTAAMGRTHHQNLALWGVMLLMPCAFLFAHALMFTSGNYRPIVSWQQMDDFRTTAPMVYYGRMICVAILLLFWLLAAGMFIEAYINYRKVRSTSVVAEDAEQRDGKVKIAILWAAVTVANLLTMCLATLVPHVICNVLIIGALILTAKAYLRHVRYIMARNEGRLASLQISRRVPLLLAMESGGQTTWGNTVAQNPIFSGNPTIDDVAQALGVTNTDLSDYVLQQDKNNFMAWVCDQRLRYCAEQIATTNRKISEIAISTGYNDLPTFTRAFKRRFGISPSEYRKENGGR